MRCRKLIVDPCNQLPEIWLAIVLASLMTGLLGACTSIIRPNFEPEIFELREGQYNLDPRHSFVHFKVPHLGLSTYVGRFNTFAATMDFDPDNIDRTLLEGSVELGSIDTGDDEVDELLSEAAWFDVDRHPQALFKTIAVEDIGNNELKISGALTIRGITDVIVLNAKFNGGADNLLTRRYTIGFSATGSFSRSVYGMDRFAGLVGDEVEIELFAEFLKSP